MVQPFITILPRKELQPFVTSYSFIELKNYSIGSKRVDYPRTALDMVFTFEGSVTIKQDNHPALSLSSSALVGLFDKKYEINFSKDIIALHVRFQACGIYPLTNIPLNECWSTQVSLDDLIGNSVEPLYNNMGNESSIDKKIELLEDFLLSKYQASKLHYKFNHCLHQISQNKSNLTVSDLASSINSNYKNLDRWFKKYVGTSPKKYLQLNRFKNILSKIEKDACTDWMNYVVEFGFHDQSHFINQFKSIAGLTPASYYQNMESYDRPQVSNFYNELV